MHVVQTSRISSTICVAKAKAKPSVTDTLGRRICELSSRALE